MPLSSQQPARGGEELAAPHDNDGHDLRWIVRQYLVRPLVEAALFYGFLLFAGHFAVARARREMTSGELYDLTPGVVGVAMDVLLVVIALTLFHIVYTLPALFVRKWLAVPLKVLMFGLFVIFLGWMHFTKFVAVRLDAGGNVTVIMPWPQEPVEVKTPMAEVRDTGLVRALIFRDNSPEGISSVSIYHRDADATARLLATAKRLGATGRRD